MLLRLLADPSVTEVIRLPPKDDKKDGEKTADKDGAPPEKKRKMEIVENDSCK